MDTFPTNVTRAPHDGNGPAESKGPPNPARPRKLLTQIVLPLVVFVVVIVGITVAANLVPRPEAGGPTIKGDPLTFPLKVAIWEPREQGYRAEFEKKTTGSYAFFFQNPHQEQVELGYLKTSCACARIECCILEGREALALSEARRFEEHLLRSAPAGQPAAGQPAAGDVLPVVGAASIVPGPSGASGILSSIDEAVRGHDGLGGALGAHLHWHALSNDENKDRGLVVPPGGIGLVRMSWNSRTRENEQVTLTAELWMQARGNIGTRATVTLAVPVAFVPPARTFPEKIDITRWNEAGVGRGEVVCWSSTRADFSLTAEERANDPCIDVKVARLTGTDCRRLEADLREKKEIATRVLSAYRVRVTAYQEKSERRLELGRFQRWVSLRSKEIGGIAGVEVVGTVYSDVAIGQEQDAGAIKLGSFKASAGAHRETFLETKPGVELALSRKDGRAGVSPDFMKVELQKVEEGAGGLPTKWVLVIDVPSGAAVGGWPSDGSVTLEKKSRGKTHLIRIPVNGNPYRGG